MFFEDCGSPKRRPENGRCAVGIGNGNVDSFYDLLPDNGIKAKKHDFYTVAENKAKRKKGEITCKLQTWSSDKEDFINLFPGV